MENTIVGVISLFVLVYLFWTLIRPESFLTAIERLGFLI